MITSFIRVLPPGCPGLHLTINCLFCHPPSKAPRELYTAKHILIPWSNFGNIWCGIFLNHAKKNTRKISSSYLNCLAYYGSLTANCYETWDLSQSSIYQHTHPKQHMALPHICSWILLFSATFQFMFPEEVVNSIFQQYFCSTSAKVAADKSCSKTNVWQEAKVQFYMNTQWHTQCTSMRA